MTTRVTSFPTISTEACDGCWSVTLELTKVLINGRVDKVLGGGGGGGISNVRTET